MTTIISYVFIAIVGFIYAIASRKRMVYINAPEDVITPEQKWKILSGHIIGSAIVGAVFVNVLLRKFQPEVYEWIEQNDYLAYSIIGSTVISFLLISGVIQFVMVRSNHYFEAAKSISENPDLLEPESYYTTDATLNEAEFWQTVQLITFNPKQASFNFKNVAQEFSSRHPAWLVQFFHRLIESKILLIKNGVLPIYQYIFRKYEGDFHDEFLEFVILQGQGKFEEICGSIDQLSTLEIEILSIKRYSLTAILTEEFARKTGKPIMSTRTFEDISEYYDFDSSDKYIKEHFPQSFKQFR